MLKLIFIFIFSLYLLIGQVGFKSIKTVDLVNKEICVSVRGAVQEEKTFKIPAFSKLEVILTQIELDKEADISTLNPNITLKDNDVINIPFKQEIKRVSINSGTYEQLITLKGVKEKTALAIIAYRNEHGLFQTIDELMNVKGIGVKKLEDIKPYIKL
ncbi:MAG: helix-hairpin-helix domain-containing protein [Erysipelotrichaceae bacterium]|nr:helix-hairpin-helix domain-containing protein [Erysipelotrichaceae bacterium]MDD3923749.1 helix-hairpin-helix domain-containing protein [Erysipelotrichaceae bacterium]MDD4642329.1 helix-hairpin-helix domain-containing protein [Erysipelotrichaceae bacterium]